MANISVIFGQSAQSLQGVAISFLTLGVTDNQVIYGFALFAFDTNTGSHTLTDISTFPTNTQAGDSGLDLVTGLSAGMGSDNCLTPANGPSGYKAACATWLRANAGVTTVTHDARVSDWQDQWIGDHDATSSGSVRPTFKSDESITKTINFNPSLSFQVIEV
jgi:hypothetical protein